MRLSSNKTKIAGVRLTEISINTINPNFPQIKTVFTIILEDGTELGPCPIPVFNTAADSSIIDALTKFMAAIEDTALNTLFTSPTTAIDEDADIDSI